MVCRALHTAPLYAPSGERIQLDDVRVTGEATIHFRKGKRIPCFDYGISVPWRLRLSQGELVTGHMEIPEFTNSYGEVPEDFEVRVPYARDWHCHPETAKRILSFMQKEGVSIVRDALLACAPDICEAGHQKAEPPRRGPPDLQRLMQQAKEWGAVAGSSPA
uniref:Activator of Hsp90 ATPase AHSA1-like N-terminal domain-containing protein n=1 Tax=Pyrodinium bahamense TaxID=73915 RepID=A0A7S0AWD2_9DINO